MRHLAVVPKKEEREEPYYTVVPMHELRVRDEEIEKLNLAVQDLRNQILLDRRRILCLKDRIRREKQEHIRTMDSYMVFALLSIMAMLILIAVK